MARVFKNQLMKIGVTGGGGFIGSRICSLLNDLGYDTLNISRSNNYDILDNTSLKKLPKLDFIIHLAAATYVPASYEDPRTFFELNVQGCNNILNIAKRDKAKFIFFSSYLYANPEVIPTPESHQTKPTNPYAASKLLAEDLCKFYHDFFEIEVVIVRPFNVFGVGQNKEFLIPKIISKAQKGKVQLFDSRPKRDYIYVDDVAQAIISLITAPQFPSFNIFNIGSGKSYSVAEVVQIIFEALGKPIDVAYEDENQNIPILETIADVSKLEKETGWKPTTSFKNGINKMIAE
jgi:UDP-glucose 4-epimerase